MTEPAYSPHLRTGVVLCGTGTAGAYHAGALQALTESGIKVDVIAAHGTGVITALATAVDGGARVWDPAGPWTDPRLRHAYRWRRVLRLGFLGLVACTLVLLSPLVVLVAAAVTYAVSIAMALVNLTGLSAQAVSAYRVMVESLFDPPILPTWLPRGLVLAFIGIAGLLLSSAFMAARSERSRRRVTGTFLWRLLGWPLDAGEPAGTFTDALWTLARGASSQARPGAAEISRRYVDVLADNFGQPGFHEVLIAVHDLDGRRDLVGAILAAPARARFESRHDVGGVREAEVVDFTGPQRELLVPFLWGATRLPVVTAPALVRFPAESYWRGEKHRICDRPELVLRLLEELAGLGVEQVVLVSPAPLPSGPHTMRPEPLGARARVGEYLRSIETSALRDACAAASVRFSGVFVVRPDHNPIGPLDFGGAYDEASDRQRTIGELIQQGHTDAYRQFIEPAAAVGDKVEAM